MFSVRSAHIGKSLSAKRFFNLLRLICIYAGFMRKYTVSCLLYTSYIIGIKEDGKGQFLSTLGRTKAVVRKALCKFLADDPVLCGQIEDKEVDAFDFQEI